MVPSRTLSSSGTGLTYSSRICSRPLTSGSGTVTCVSKRPGRTRACRRGLQGVGVKDLIRSGVPGTQGGGVRRGDAADPVERFGEVRGGEHDDARVLLEAVHLDQQLIERHLHRLLLLGVAVGACGTHDERESGIRAGSACPTAMELSFCAPMASISSMKIMHGERFLAAAKSSRTRLAPTPTKTCAEDQGRMLARGKAATDGDARAPVLSLLVRGVRDAARMRGGQRDARARRKERIRCVGVALPQTRIPTCKKRERPPRPPRRVRAESCPCQAVQ